jgi:hypothetical protein
MAIMNRCIEAEFTKTEPQKQQVSKKPVETPELFL